MFRLFPHTGVHLWEIAQQFFSQIDSKFQVTVSGTPVLVSCAFCNVSIMEQNKLVFAKFQQECIPIGCVPSAAVAVRGRCLPGGVSAQGSVCPWGCLPQDVCLGGVCLGGVCPGGVCPGGGVCPRGGCLPRGGVYPGGCLRRGCVCQTDRCKNITLP